VHHGLPATIVGPKEETIAPRGADRRRLQVDTTMIFASLVVAAVLALFVVILAFAMRRAQRRGAADLHALADDQAIRPTQAVESGPDVPAPGSGAAECYADCMRGFRWELKTRLECARVCGVKAA